MDIMKLHASGEDYLEAILILQRQIKAVRSIDLARYMGFTKPSISRAVSILWDGGFLDIDENGLLNLTGTGREIAEKIYERHLFLSKMLIAIGVKPEIAEQDACRMEHVISTESFRCLKEAWERFDRESNL